MLGFPGHSTRYIPNAGRSSRSVAATPSSGGMHNVIRKELVRKTRRPPGRNTRCGLGNPVLWICPEAGTIFRDRQVEARVRVSDRLSVAMDERKIEPIRCVRQVLQKGIRARGILFGFR